MKPEYTDEQWLDLLERHFPGYHKSSPSRLWTMIKTEPDKALRALVGAVVGMLVIFSVFSLPWFLPLLF